MKPCPNCEKHIDTEARFCPHCGFNFLQSNQTASKLEASAIGQSRACPKCRAAVGASAKFCNNCATPLTGSAHAVKSNVKPTIAALAGLVIMVFIAVIAFLISPYKLTSVSSPSMPPISSLVDSGKLTNAKAQRALDQWVGTRDGKIVVQGIQEVPQENIAKTDIRFDNFQWKSKSAFTGQPVSRQYSGPGFAIFTHYNDGRWVLTRVQTSQGFDSVWWENIKIEAQ